MSISRVSLCLIFLTFLTSPLVLCSSSPKVDVAASVSTEEVPKRHIDPPAMLVSDSTEVDSSSSISKIDDESARNSAIAGFFRYRFPFHGWPFPMVKPTTNPSVPATPVTGAGEEESEKVPSSPSEGNSEGNRDGGNA
ncbi:Tapetum specific protein TAP35/TAP44 [Raphanus sativus]|uniref:Uncharacterized protein LOC108821426 n=1 Tax=Raphanus sativus TaxID=3726 RepID=A0A6J0KSE9_RAPSA|nr:uncharacterized protein LOC108821426 [Raphanus sativus]KAJ4880946.1 Tapetum specific protein TAP35/TAP44 [Raphanus sativus]